MVLRPAGVVGASVVEYGTVIERVGKCVLVVLLAVCPRACFGRRIMRVPCLAFHAPVARLVGLLVIKELGDTYLRALFIPLVFAPLLPMQPSTL